MKKRKIILLLMGLSLLTTLTSCKGSTENSVSSEIQESSVVSQTEQSSELSVDVSAESVTEISVDESSAEVSEISENYSTLTATPLEDFLYDIVNDDTAENGKAVRLLRYKYEGDRQNIVIPVTVKVDGQTYKTKLGDGVFLEKNIVSLTIPDEADFTEIPKNFCQRCKELVTVNLPNKITTIGDEAFRTCSKLNWTELPSHIKNIGKSAFAGTSLTGKLVITEDMTITDYSFNACDFTEVVIEKQLTEIPYGLFQENFHLKSVVLPETLTTIHKWAFERTSIENITIPKSVTFMEDKIITTEGTHNTKYTGVMSGYRGTEAERYAEKYNVIFAPLD